MRRAVCLFLVGWLGLCAGCPPAVDGDGSGQPIPVDSDGDGISDELDDCPNTAAGVAVGNDGCPVVNPPGDSDGDGVADEDDDCPNTLSGAVVDAAGCAASQRDSDGDGVNDDVDQCPGTTAGTAVGADGCVIPATATDSDGDGVPNDADDCPGTQSGRPVDARGCAANQRDSDGDGVTDHLDLCASTPPESVVDARGCAASQRDGDRDGVSDDRDECPETAAAVVVDARGCSAAQRDSDGDGVTDDVDECPGTAVGVAVGAKGCPTFGVGGGGGGGGTVGGGGGSECGVPGDCDDDNACTTETCVNGFCGHTAIANCVPCDVPPVCPVIEVVFVMDTSGSMADEAAALCAGVGQLVAALDGLGITLLPHMYGITQHPGGAFSCLTTDVVAALGGSVPGDADACPFPNTLSAFESWGPATAIVAERFGWTAGARRVVVPISDEGPCDGNLPEGCNDPGDDRDSILNAVAVANQHGVAISPVTGTGSNDCVKTLAGAAAVGTGGFAFNSTDPVADLAEAIYEILLRSCDPGACDDGNACTLGDVCVLGVCAGTATEGCVPCRNDVDCFDGNGCTSDACAAGVCEHAPNYPVETECCAPADGSRAVIDDGNICTDDVCDPETGTVAHVPTAQPTACDDGHQCTINDACEGGECAGTSIPGCRECQVNADCNDNSVCTTDLCENNLCRYRNNYHANTTCCHPVTGVILPISDQNPCTMDACNPVTGVPVHTSISGPVCDDGVGCTIFDQCVAGTCVGTDVNAMTCSADGDCPFGACDTAAGHCRCAHPTPICTEVSPKVCSVSGKSCLSDADCAGDGVCVCDHPPDADCVDDGVTVTLKIMIGAGTETVTGAQVYVDYDQQCLDFLSIAPCAGDDLFTFVLSANVNEATGLIFYAVTTNPQTRELEGTSSEHALACATFRRLGGCVPHPPCIIENANPLETILADPTGSRIPLAVCPCAP